MRVYARELTPGADGTSAAVAAALMVAAPAQADDQSYLNYLEVHGQSTTAYPYSPGKLVMVGQIMCDRIRGGMSPADAAQLPQPQGFVDGPGIVATAQHELCPDTLPRP